jgi:hypothetical protein
MTYLLRLNKERVAQRWPHLALLCGCYCVKVQYIHLNPARAGLARRPEDWRWSSVHDYQGGLNCPPATPGGLSVDRVLLPADAHTPI